MTKSIRMRIQLRGQAVDARQDRPIDQAQVRAYTDQLVEQALSDEEFDPAWMALAMLELVRWRLEQELIGACREVAMAQMTMFVEKVVGGPETSEAFKDSTEGMSEHDV